MLSNLLESIVHNLIFNRGTALSQPSEKAQFLCTFKNLKARTISGEWYAAKQRATTPRHGVLFPDFHLIPDVTCKGTISLKALLEAPLF